MLATFARTSDAANVARRELVVPWSWIGALLVGYPLLHVAHSLTWHVLPGDDAVGLDYYIPFWLTVVTLQTLSAVLILRATRATGISLADLGLRVPVYVITGLLFSAAYLWHRSLYLGMVLHAFLNLVPLSA